MCDTKDASSDDVVAEGGDEKVLESGGTEDTPTRQRTMTEKGYVYQLNVKTSNLKTKKNDLVKRMRSTLLNRGQCLDLAKFKRELSEAQVVYSEFQDLVDDIKVFAKPDEYLRDVERVVEQVDREWASFETDIRAEIKHLEFVEQQKIECESVHSKRSGRVSNKSEKSKPSSVISHSVKDEKFQLRKEEAALKAKLAFTEAERKLKLEQKKAELLKLDQEAKLEKLKIESDLAQYQAKLNVCALTEKEELIDAEQDLNSVPPIDKDKDMGKFLDSLPAMDNSHLTPVKQEKSLSPINQTQPIDNGAFTTLSPNATPFTPYSVALEKCMDKLVETSDKLVTATVEQNTVNKQLAVAGQLPKISIPVFAGDPLQYPTWNSSFSALIDSKPMDAQTKLNFLSQYVSGKPKQVVDQYILIGTEDAYKSARALLQERYGNCNVVGSAFMNKLENWPRIGVRDSEALRDLSDFLQKIIAARESIPSLAVLDFAKENVKILAKLPHQIQNKWRGTVQACRVSKGDGAYPPFSEFAAFVKESAARANIPELEELYKFSSPRGRSFKDPQFGGPGGKLPKDSEFRSFATQAELPIKEPRSQGPDKKEDPNKKNGNPRPDKKDEPKGCVFCKEKHHLNDCKKFAEIPLSQRKNFFFEKRLCFGCASSSNHQAASCSNKLACCICSGNHPTCLHHEKPPKETVVNCTNVCMIPEQDGGPDHAMIVPVLVRQAGKPSKEILQYAVLDDQSNVSFVSQRLCELLDLEGPPTDLLLTTMQERNVHVSSNRICGLEVLDLCREHAVKLPMLFKRDVIPASRSQIPKAEVALEWEHLRPIADKLMPYDPDVEISLLIGSNCPSIVRPREVLVGGEDDPYGQRSLMGWGIVGKVCKSGNENENNNVVCNKLEVSEIHEHFAFTTKVKEIINPQKILRVLESDFVEGSAKTKPYSVEDERFLTILENAIVKREDGHYEMPLPLKSNQLRLPYNRQLVVKRWHQLLARFKRNPKFLEDYQAFMKEVIASCAERVPPDRLEVQDGMVNYVPHTGVYHPKKPDQIRVVFDCSASYEGVSLNDYLLQGPDLMNDLLGILCRFRQERVGFMTDIKSMFHQFMVSEEHRDLLRFLWWENGDPTKEVVEYRMKVHLFGAGSSPGCANFGLKRAADDGQAEFGEEAAEFIRRDFYVDDGLRSVPTVEKAVTLIKASQSICAKAGLKLHKIMSNRREVLEMFPLEERAKGLKELDLKVDPLPLERALGVTWCVENDSFQFRIEIRDRPLTRRGVLSTVSSIYDPSGYVAPVTLKGKQILQQMCRDKLDWDSPIPEGLRPQWEKWRQDVMNLEKLQIPRCFKPENFGEVKVSELHHFSDASLQGYGQCSYLRLVNTEDRVHCSLVIGKARVVPLKQLTVPRLELAAATVSAKVSVFLRQELPYADTKEYFWTDSKIVLGYVSNEAKRFHIYVANRVQQIRDATDPGSWLYVDTESNPADHASRGLTASQLSQDSKWLTGPDFLWKSGPFEPREAEEFHVIEGDPEVKKASAFMSHVGSTAIQFPNGLKSDRLQHMSSWQRMMKVIALCLQLKAKLTSRQKKLVSQTSSEINELSPKVTVTLTQLQEAEREVLKVVQREQFHEEIQVLEELKVSGDVASRALARQRNVVIKKSSCLYRLDPFLDDVGLIRVGGRIKRANLPFATKHPVVLPRKSHVTDLLIRFCHFKVNHMGRGITQNELRQRGYWIIGGSSAVSNCISQCVTCRKLRGSLQLQKMADLPVDRVEPSPPFSYSAVDFFGPFLIKEKRSQVKRYGVIFTCMASRGVHLETANSLNTSSFMNALSRFLNRRGPVRQLRCDQGTNFMGARNELKSALEELDQDRLQEYLAEKGCEWIPFELNVPHSSHMGGSWERLIKTVRSALQTVLLNAGTQLDDEAFRTFMTEAECIVNSRPLTTKELNDPGAPEPLTPNHLLTQKPKVVLPPPGKFQRADLYSRMWWRRVQYLANEFWLRWRREFLQSLQSRDKWVHPKRNLSVGDIVISKEDEGSRNQWPLARVVEVYVSEDGCVRKVKIMKADGALDNEGKRQKPPTFLDRPIHKLVLLLPAEESVAVNEMETREFPNEEPSSQ